MMKQRARVLMTGGSGFVGKHLGSLLKSHGWNTVGRFRSKQFDLTSIADTMAVLKGWKPDIVIHLAAKCGGIGANMNAPADFWYDNLMMGMNVIKGCTDLGMHLIMMGTTCSYPKFCPVPFKEEDLFNGYPEETNAPYGIAKKALLVGCDAYNRQYGLKSTYLISANMYGEHDHFEPQTSHVIPALIKTFHEAKASKAKEVTLWGDGSPTRDFLYAADLCEAIESAMIHGPHYPTPINIGTGVQTSIKALAEMTASIVGYSGDIIWDTSRPNGQPARALNIDKARQMLGWVPKTKLIDGLQKTYDWYKKEFPIH